MSNPQDVLRSVAASLNAAAEDAGNVKHNVTINHQGPDVSELRVEEVIKHSKYKMCVVVQEPSIPLSMRLLGFATLTGRSSGGAIKHGGILVEVELVFVDQDGCPTLVPVLVPVGINRIVVQYGGAKQPRFTEVELCSPTLQQCSLVNPEELRRGFESKGMDAHPLDSAPYSAVALRTVDDQTEERIKRTAAELGWTAIAIEPESGYFVAHVIRVVPAKGSGE